MCQHCAGVRDLRKRRLLTKDNFSPEEEQAFQELLTRYRGALDAPEREIREFVRQASADDLSSLSSIRAELEPRIGAYGAEFETVFREGGRQGAQAGRALAARRHSLSIAFDVVPERTLDEIDDWVETAAGSTLDTITEDATRWLRGAHEDGLSVPDIADQLNDELFEGRLEAHVAERAARTATVATSRAGDHSAHEDADGVIAERWISELRDNTRESHEQAHGQTVAVDQSFDIDGVFMAHPADPGAPVGEIANCLCRAEPLFRDQLSEAQIEAIEAGERIVIDP